MFRMWQQVFVRISGRLPKLKYPQRVKPSTTGSGPRTFKITLAFFFLKYYLRARYYFRRKSPLAIRIQAGLKSKLEIDPGYLEIDPEYLEIENPWYGGLFLT